MAESVVAHDESISAHIGIIRNKSFTVAFLNMVESILKPNMKHYHRQTIIMGPYSLQTPFFGDILVRRAR
jgi:hypothetical protein